MLEEHNGRTVPVCACYEYRKGGILDSGHSSVPFTPEQTDVQMLTDYHGISTPLKVMSSEANRARASRIYIICTM